MGDANEDDKVKGKNMMTEQEIESATLEQLNDELAAGGFSSQETQVDKARQAVRSMIAELSNREPKTYFAVCNVNGPISVEIVANSVAEAIEEFDEMDKRELIDDSQSDFDNYYDRDCTGLSEDEFDAVLRFFNCECIKSLDPIVNAHAGTVGHLENGWALWRAGERPTVEVCRDTEWVREHELDKDDIFETDLNDAADSYRVAVFERLRDAGFDASWAKGQRGLYHGWNGSQFTFRSGIVGSWNKLSDQQIEAIEKAKQEAQAEVQSTWAQEKLQFKFATDSETGTIAAESFSEACEKLNAMVPDDSVADGAWGWVEDEDGERFKIGQES